MFDIKLSNHTSSTLRKILVGCCFASVMAIVWWLHGNDNFEPKIIVGWMNDNPASAILIFIFLYALAMIALLPSLPLNMSAGFFWGGMAGGCISSLAATLGGWVAFLIARNILGQPFADKFKNKRLAVVQTELQRNGLKFLAVARINPIVPTGILNYLCGMTRLRVIDFLWVTFLCSLPGSVTIAYLGDIFQNFTDSNTEAEDILSGIMMIFAALTVLFCMKFTVKIIKTIKSI